MIRSGLYDVFQAFDFADPSTSNGQRDPDDRRPTGAVHDERPARPAMLGGDGATRLLARADLDDAGRIRLAYLDRPTAGPPTDEEIDPRLEITCAASRRDLRRRGGRAAEARPPRAWQALCQAILVVQRVPLSSTDATATEEAVAMNAHWNDDRRAGPVASRAAPHGRRRLRGAGPGRPAGRGSRGPRRRRPAATRSPPGRRTSRPGPSG